MPLRLQAPTLRTVRGKASSKAFSVTRPSRASVVVRADSNNGAVPAAAAASSTGQTVTYAKIPPLVWSSEFPCMATTHHARSLAVGCFMCMHHAR